MGAGLHALGIGLIVMSLVSAGLMLRWKKTFHPLLSSGASYAWCSRIWPAQCRLYIVGISVFCCGALPVLLIRECLGEEEAGKFGMTHKILEMILFLGATAFTTGAHQLGKCYSANDKNEFWRTGKKLIRSGLLIVAAASIAAWLGLQLATLIGLQFPQRLVANPILAIMLATSLVTCLNWGMEILIRSNGEEMLWAQYLVRVLVCLPLLWLSIQSAGVMGAAVVLFAIPLFLVLPWNAILTKSFRSRWDSR